MFGGLRLAPGVRVALERRCAGACESCGLEWPWALYVFRVEDSGRCTVANLIVLCGKCSTGREGEFAHSNRARRHPHGQQRPGRCRAFDRFEGGR